MQEGLRKIAERFASPEHVGPKIVADFEDIQKPDEGAIRKRDAYERVWCPPLTLELTCLLAISYAQGQNQLPRERQVHIVIP